MLLSWLSCFFYFCKVSVNRIKHQIFRELFLLYIVTQISLISQIFYFYDKSFRLLLFWRIKVYYRLKPFMKASFQRVSDNKNIIKIFHGFSPSDCPSGKLEGREGYCWKERRKKRRKERSNNRRKEGNEQTKEQTKEGKKERIKRKKSVEWL